MFSFVPVKKLKAVYKFINRCLFTNSKLMNAFQIIEYNTSTAYQNIKIQFHIKEVTSVLHKRFK